MIKNKYMQHRDTEAQRYTERENLCEPLCLCVSVLKKKLNI